MCAHSRTPGCCNILSWIKWSQKMAQNSVATSGNSCSWIGEFKKGRISSHTPMANAIVESSHSVIGQILCTMFMAPWFKQRLSLRLHLMVHVPLPQVSCVVFPTLHHREWLLEHWHLVVMWSSTFQFSRTLQPSLLTNSHRHMHTCCARINNTRHECKVGQQVHINNHFCQPTSWSMLGLDHFQHHVTMQVVLLPFTRTDTWANFCLPH